MAFNATALLSRINKGLWSAADRDCEVVDASVGDLMFVAEAAWGFCTSFELAACSGLVAKDLAATKPAKPVAANIITIARPEGFIIVDQ